MDLVQFKTLQCLREKDFALASKVFERLTQKSSTKWLAANLVRKNGKKLLASNMILKPKKTKTAKRSK